MSTAFAAPHILRKPEPWLDHVGKTPAARAAAKARALGVARAPSAYPATVNVLFLRVDFPDETAVTDWSSCSYTTPPASNADDQNTTGLGTWSDSVYAYGGDADYWVSQAATRFPQYYTEVSYGKLTVNITVSATVYRLPLPMCAYGRETETDIQRLLRDAVALADADTDFSLYDAVVVVHAGASQETDVSNDSARDLWSLYYSETCIDGDPVAAGCQPLTADGKTITEFMVMPQTGSQDGVVTDPLGVYVHEFGHWLGLPDLYDTSWLVPGDGIGVWGLMGYGTYNGSPPGSTPPHPEAWSKVFLNWATPELLTEGIDAGLKTLAPIWNDATQVIKVPASSLYPNQYFLLENRRQANFDSALPGEGMLAWLINQDYIDAYLADNTVNARARGVRLIEADGLRNLLDGSDGDAGSSSDPFPGSTGNTRFTPLSTPSSTPFNGYAWVSIHGIADNTSSISLTIDYAPLPPQNLSGSLQSPDAVLSWTANAETDVDHYNIYRDDVFLALALSSPYTDVGVGGGHTYKVTAVDASGNESANSQTVSVQAPSGGGGGGCFIATAAYGSYLADEVMVLRRFRDRYLLTSPPGRSLVKMYYRYSPPLAAFIARHETLRAATRFALTPVVYSIKYPAAALCVLLAFFVLSRSRTIKRGRPQQPSS